MRILYFSRDYTTHDHRFLCALAKTEHRIAYLRLEDGGFVYETRPLPAGIEVVDWAGGRKPVRLSQIPALALDLKRVIRDFRPDLVHAGPLQTAAFLTALVGFRPLVSMSWGYDLLCDAQRNLLWRWVTRYTLQCSAVMIGDCATIRRQAVALGMQNERIVTFPWGVDVQHFTPVLAERSWQKAREDLRSSFGWNNDHFVVISTRSWAPLYGIEELARAFVLAAQQRPSLRLMMLSGGPLHGLIRRIFLEGDVLDRVVFPGTVDQMELPAYYRAADLYLSASHFDGVSISLLEAMACGLPVLVSDIPGNLEWLNDEQVGAIGWSFPCGQVEALALALMRAVDERACLTNMGRSARALVEKRGDWEKNFPHLLQAYQMAVNQT